MFLYGKYLALVDSLSENLALVDSLSENFKVVSSAVSVWNLLKLAVKPFLIFKYSCPFLLMHVTNRYYYQSELRSTHVELS